MTDLLLPLLTVIIAALAVLGVVGFVRPRQAGRALWAAAALAGVAAAAALLALLAGLATTVLALPVGLPGAAFRLTLDPLAAFFTVLLFGAGAALCASIAPRPPPDAAAVAASLAGFGLAVLGADSPARAAGIAVGGGAIWLLRPSDRAGAVQLAVALLAAGSVAAAAHAPQPALLWLAVLGPGALAGLAPLHGWLPAAHGDSAPAAALLSGAAVPVALYAMLRLLFAPLGAVPPAWWGLPLLAVGAASIVAGSLHEARQPDLDAALAAGTTRQTGLIALGIGLALMARAADLPGATALALAAVLLLAAVQAISGTLLAIAAGAIRHGAGTRRFDRLGGLAHRMPVTTVCLLAGLFSTTALPPGAGFAAIWLLFHAALGLPHAGLLPFRLLLCATAATLGLAGALTVATLLRVAGVVCLGRARTPRSAVAEEPGRAVRRAMAGLAATGVAWGVLAGALLRLLADAPVRTLADTGLGGAASWTGIASGGGTAGYAALPLAVLLLGLGGAAGWARRRQRARTGMLDSVAWNDGFAASPGWLPFGDPAAQTDGAGFIPDLPRPSWLPSWLPLPRLRLPALPALPALPGLPAPALALLLAAALLALCAWFPPP